MELLYRKYKSYLLITVLTLLSTFILWLPFLLKSDSINGIQTPGLNFETVLKNWDGPLYIIPAKTWYNENHPLLQSSQLGLPDNYFAAHLPLYPATIAMFGPFLGYLKAMIFSTLLASIALYNIFYYVIKKLKLSSRPLALTFIFMFFAPRILALRSVGSPEPLFMLLILSSLFFFAQKKYLLASVIGALSVLTKSPGILLFAGYGLYFAAEYIRTKKVSFDWLWILLVPTAFLGLCFFYSIQLGDFWAYFHSGNNLHLLFPPFQVFNYQAQWVDSSWLEDILFIYLFYGVTLAELFNFVRVEFKLPTILAFLKDKTEKIFHTEEMQRFKSASFYFMIVFFCAIISIQHRDVSRYSLPMLPLALITFDKFFTSRRFIIILLLLLPAIYLYTWNFMIVNTAPITVWAPFL